MRTNAEAQADARRIAELEGALRHTADLLELLAPDGAGTPGVQAEVIAAIESVRLALK